jgi:HK97 family phage prohead protease/HK97 family phage major capsid protein
MDIKNKILYFDSKFTTKAASEDDDSITIEGYASTNDRDRQGDVVPAGVWKSGIANYLLNPIILAYHNHTMPIGKMIDYKVDEKGLWIKAQIPSEVGDVYKLIKKGILSAFSIGFRVKDAEYKQDSETFMIKDLELHEISVVSVPANQNTLFSLAKAFNSAEEFELFKQQFADVSESAKGLESSTDANSETIKEWKMDPKELEKLLADAAAKAAAQAAQAVVEAQTKAAQEAQRKADEDAQLQAKIKAAVSAVQTVDTGSEKLLAEVEKRLNDQAESHKSALEGLEAALKEKAAELEAIQKSRMQFSDIKSNDLSYADKEKAVLLSKITGKSIEDTNFGRSIITKYSSDNNASPAGSGGQFRLWGATWETEVSTAMENEVRQRLVVAGTLRSVPMNNPIMKVPLNPEAGYATWVTNAQFGTSNSSGATATHRLKELTLNSYKLATREYIAFEEDEDSLVAILPVVRDAMIRRMAKSVDKALLIGAGSGSDPITGFATYDAASAVTLDLSDITGNISGAGLTAAKLQLARKDLGYWGLEPSELVIFVNTQSYYELLQDSNFLTVDKVGIDRAVILTGQIGSIGNTPVVVSAEFAAPAAGAVAALIINPRNFIAGNHRGLRVDTDDNVETQSRILVASMRMAMTQISDTDGEAVSAIRYVA